MTTLQSQQLDGKLNTAQLALLKVVARPVSDEDLNEIRKMIVKYFIEKLRDRADEVWTENNWTEEDVLNMDLRVKKINP